MPYVFLPEKYKFHYEVQDTILQPIWRICPIHLLTLQKIDSQMQEPLYRFHIIIIEWKLDFNL